MHPTPQEFQKMLYDLSLERIVDDVLFTGTPFLFSAQPQRHRDLIRRIGRSLGVPPVDICVVGSAQLGFSLAPNKFGVPFGEHSDIDVIVVSSGLFDEGWLDILTNRRMPWSNLSYYTRERIRDYRRYDYIYNGWIYPDSIPEVLQIGNRWLNTFNGLSQIPELSAKPVRGRLYKTWEHARVYHRRGLQTIKDTILPPNPNVEG